ncbi:MAG: twin-arginine translocase TatA/TatE family subunit [Tissierellia bacterium]|nr:twin-arginine translocase TatA/TatE family subunit [Tissierellia bacterium]
MFGKLGLGELLLLFGVVLLLFGPKKLPELARSMGQAVKEFKKGQEEIEETLNADVTVTETKTTEEVKEVKEDKETENKQ